MKGKANKATAALAKRSVALECFGLSKVRYAGCLSVSEKELRLRRVQHQVAGEYAWPDLTRAKINLTSFLAA